MKLTDEEKQQEMKRLQKIIDAAFKFYETMPKKKAAAVGNRCPSVVVIPYYVDVEIIEP